MCVLCESQVLLFNLPSRCQRTECTLKSYKKLDERNGRTGTRFSNSTGSLPQSLAGWHPARLTSTCMLHTHGEDAHNQKRQPLTCPPSASRCQVRLASWNRLQSTPASHPWWGLRPCCFPTPALRKKHLLPLRFCFLESCAPGQAYIFISSRLTGSFTPPWKIFCPICWRFSDLLSACGHNRKLFVTSPSLSVSRQSMSFGQGLLDAATFKQSFIFPKKAPISGVSPAGRK